MHEAESSKRHHIRDIFSRAYITRHFAPIMGLVATIAFCLIFVGLSTQNDFLVTISSTLFSASTIGVIFKFVGYDVFLLTLMREMVYERRFLEQLNVKELRRVIRGTIAIMRGLPPEESIKEKKYNVFEKYLLDDLVGITVNDHRVIVELKPHDLLEHRVMLGKTTTNYEITNESPKIQPLFSVEGEDDVMYKGTATLPECLKTTVNASSVDPTQFWDLQKDSQDRYVGLSIDGNHVVPEKTVEYIDENDPSRGVKFKVKYHSVIKPKARPKSIVLKHKCIYDTKDYIVRTFSRYAEDVEVIVNKPENIEVHVSWLLTAVGKDPHLKKEDPQTSPTSYIQKVEGVLVPGNGFIIMWWPKEGSLEGLP